MGIIVKKFGGTSVADIGRIRHVARLIREYGQNHPQDQVVVVVSAMAGETNRLIGLAKSCVPNPAPRELDQLIATGEQVTSALLAMALVDLGVPAKSMLGSQASIATDSRYNGARIEGINNAPIRALVTAGVVPVIAGFQGITVEGDVTTLGRGGSDITAVAVAAAIEAAACYIYTDVEGVYSTDPRICKKARLLARISHEEMLEMATFGAKVLHPRSVYFAKRYRVPLVTLSTFVPGPGTWIVQESELMERPVVSGITYRTDEAKLTVLGVPDGIRGISRVFSELASQEIFIDAISQTGYAQGRTSISFTVPDEGSSRALEAVQRILPEIAAQGASIERDIAKISVVGVGMQYQSGVAAKLFAALASAQIEVQMISTSEIRISVIVSRKYCEMAVRVLHDAFISEHPEISLHSDGSNQRLQGAG